MAGLDATLSFDIETYSNDDDYVYIDDVTRNITISNPSKVFGTQYDKESVIVKFRVLNVVSDAFKMSDSVVRVNWRDSSGRTGTSITVNNRVLDNTYEFAWLVPGEALKNKGQLDFVVKATKLKADSDEVDKIWGSKLAQTLVPESIYVKVSALSDTEKDQVAQMLLLVDSKVTSANSALESQKNVYLSEIVSEGDKQIKRLADLGLYVDSEGYIVQEVDD